MKRSVVLFLCVVAATCLGVQRLGPRWSAYVFEYLLLATALGAVWAGWGRERFGHRPFGQRVVIAVLPFLLTLGVVVKAPRFLYPFVSWGMFGRSPTGELVQYRIFVVEEDGAPRRLMPAVQVSDVAASSVDRHIRNRFERARTSGRPEDLDHARALIVSLVELDRVDAAPRDIRVERCSTMADHPGPLACTVEFRIERERG